MPVALRRWLPQPVQALLTNWGTPAPTGFVFPGKNIGRSIDSVDKVMRGICAALSIERVTPHYLRRTHGSTITALGFGRDAMNRIQNHREGGIASVYDRHQYGDENKRVMEAVAAHMIQVVTDQPPTTNVVPMRAGT